MKINLKTTLVILAASLITFTASAQRSTKAHKGRKATAISTNALVGVWEYTNSPGLLKIFGGDNTFANIQMGPNGSVKTHSGKFIVDSKQQYTEVINNAIADSQYALADQTYQIQYTFSADRNTVTLAGSVKGKNGEPGINYTEVLHRL